MKVDGDAINAALTRAVAESALGTKIREYVAEEVKRIGDRYDNPLRKLVEAEILTLIRKVIETDYHEQLLSIVRARVTAALTDDLVGELWNQWWKRVSREG